MKDDKSISSNKGVSVYLISIFVDIEEVRIFTWMTSVMMNEGCAECYWIFVDPCLISSPINKINQSLKKHFHFSMIYFLKVFCISSYRYSS